MTAHPQLERLLAIVDAFRGEGGCAWYEAQTHASLVRYLTEESAELVEALEADDPAEIREELGDVLFQVLFHADVAAQRPDGEAFSLEDVARDQAEKLIRRNPHVFGERPTRDVDEIIRLWTEAKAIEKRDRTSVLDGVPRGMSALALSQKLLGKERLVSATALSPDAGAPAGEELELGRALLAVVRGAEARGLDAERAMRVANRELEAQIRAAEDAPGD